MPLSLLAMILACSPEARSPAAPVPLPAVPSAEPWAESLAAPVPALPPTATCPDADGDGFPSALVCPATAPEQADCDDTAPAVTPATERWVRPGPFLMGSAGGEAGRDEQPVHVVTLSGFCLDRLEVDTASWAAARGEAPPPPDRTPLPAEGLTWEQARDLCAHLGKALPTEAQWEKAARGGCEGGQDPARCDPGDLRPYPWGDAPPDCARANHASAGPTGPRPCRGGAQPVGALPAGAGPYGHLDLAGNVWEYVADPYHPAVYGDGTPRTDPGGPAEGAVHGLRGGAWNTFSANMRVANRFQDLVMGSAAGVRCARPTAASVPDAVSPLDLVAVRGEVARADGAVLAGRALYVTAFDARDLDPTGMPIPGRSPLAEIRLEPNGAARQPFDLPVPRGPEVLLSAALDAGTSGPAAPPSGSGGVGRLDHLVRVDADLEGLRLLIAPLPPGGSPAP